MRGQAWIIFDDVQSATSALQAENGYTFFGRNIKVAYAKEKSDRIAKRDGSYVPQAKRRKLKSVAPAPETTTTTTSAAVDIPSEAALPPAETATPEEENVPSHILFAQDLPLECKEMMLEILFRQYAGFKEVRIPRPGLAFIEFEGEPQATLALQGLNGFKLTTDNTLNLKYGKS